MYNYSLERVRDQEFPNRNDAVYVDHAGTTLFSKSQLDAVHKDLTSNLYGNPHSHNYSSKLSTDLIDQTRYRLLRFFGASPEEYSLVFTSGCTDALKLVASSFTFSKGNEGTCGIFSFLQDNHTSVQGMRGQVTQKGVPFVCLDETELETAMARSKERLLKNKDVAPPSTNASLIAIPAQSNFSGKRYPLSWIKNIQEFGLDFTNVRQDIPPPSSCQWYVLLDAASLASTSPLHLGQEDMKPDFVTVSFYKIFGYPTGLGALLVHRRASHLLSKTYYGGGTVSGSTAKEDFQVFRQTLHDRFEDGTLPFLNIICLRHGIDAIGRLAGGMDAVSKHVFCVAQFFYHHLTRLKHGNGQPLAEVYGGSTFQKPEDQGGIITFNLKRSDGKFIGYAEVDKFAQLHDVHLRTGCFCNIGACQQYLHISSQMIKDNLDAGHVCGDNIDLIDGFPTGAVRISFGYMSTLDDAKACLRFITDSFLEDVSHFPSFPYPEWYKREKTEMRMDEEAKGGNAAKDDSVMKSDRDDMRSFDVGDGEKHGDKRHESSPSLEKLSLKKESLCESSKNSGILSEADQQRTVTDIFLYPVKSCGAFRVTEWEIGSKGLLFDREWVLVSDTGVTLGQKREPKMCLITPHIDLASRKLILGFPSKSPFELPLDQEEEAKAMANLCNNKVCGDRVDTYDCGDAVADWLCNVLLRPGIRLLRQQSQDTRVSKQKDRATKEAPSNQRLSLANESQMLLLNRASVRALLEKMAELGNVDEAEDSKMRTAPQDISEDNMILRFRGNLVINGNAPFEEEEWTSINVRDNTVVCQNLCTRCSMICMDQTTGERSREPLKTLAMWRGKKLPFGVHSRINPRSDGKKQMIHIGDTITVL